MSEDPESTIALDDPDRRVVLRAAGGVAIGAMTAAALAMSSPASAQNAASPNPVAATRDRNNAALGARLQGVQHFGLTVQNMDRAFAFYTEVLGGTEVMRDGDF